MTLCVCIFVREARVIPVYNDSDLLPVVLEETGGLGVDIVVDSGGKITPHDELVFRDPSINK